uniref:DUF4216 domain-containing protein n=1 Tax=Solanum lycopersicum TaxID=4081 RepID=K4B608_SOLLC
MQDLLSLSRGPTKYSMRSNGYVANGYRFHAQDYDNKLRTQNCGVVVFGENDEDSENLDYYGVLTNVIELKFIIDQRVILFRCNWSDVYDEIKGVKKDEYDFVSVNPSRFFKTDEAFILANQASQVFYDNDNSNKGWQVVVKTQPRDSFDIVEQMDDDIVELESPSQKKRKRTKEVQDETIEDLSSTRRNGSRRSIFTYHRDCEKCCGPQTRSHVFGFGDGVMAKDLKGETSSKAELLSALRSTRQDIKSLKEENKCLTEENKSLKIGCLP